MSFRDAGLGLLGGLLVGAVAGLAFGTRLTGVPKAIAALAPAPNVGVRPRACPPCPSPAPDGAADGLAAVVRAQEEQIRGLTDAAFGRPLVWPDPAVRQDVEQEHRESLADCAPGVRLIDMDCSEPPCMAALDFGPAETDRAPPADGNTINHLCPSLSWSGNASFKRRCFDGEQHQFSVLRLGGTSSYADANQVPGLDFGENHATRWRVRTEDLSRALACP